MFEPRGACGALRRVCHAAGRRLRHGRPRRRASAGADARGRRGRRVTLGFALVIVLVPRRAPAPMTSGGNDERRQRDCVVRVIEQLGHEAARPLLTVTYLASVCGFVLCVSSTCRAPRAS